MPRLSYDAYYEQQMGFLDRYLRYACLEEDRPRIRALESLQSRQTIFFLPEFLAIPPERALQTTRIGYGPLSDKNYSGFVRFAPDGHQIDPEQRRLSRYRLVHGPVNFYLDRQFERPTEMSVITACAPNLMGTSAADLEAFSKGGARNRTLNAVAYEAACVRLANFIVSHAKWGGHTRLIMPAFGVGVYIRTLNPESKAHATEIMYKAFAKAATHYALEVDWIVWRKHPDAEHIVNTLARYSHDAWMQPVLHEDMLSYGKECLEAGIDAVLLNPGSDRTIGGAYTHKRPKTLEEQMAQQSDLVLLHSELNEAMVQQFNEHYQLYESELSSYLEALKRMKFDTHLHTFQQKAQEMLEKAKVNPNYQEAASVAHRLCERLSEAKTNFLEHDRSRAFDEVMDVFKAQCYEIIKDVRPTLECHREWKGAIAKFLCDVASYMTFGLSARLGLFAKTDSALKLEAFERTVDDVPTSGVH